MSRQNFFSKKQDEQASQWVARHERGLTEAEQSEFEDWLLEDSSNEACFFEHQVAWASFDVMDGWKPVYTGPPNPDLFKSRGASRWKRLLVYGGLAAMLVFGFWFYSAEQQMDGGSMVASGTVYRSTTYEKHFLEDGSSFYLLPNSEVVVTFSEEERTVEFARGEAYFSVAHDPSRPFVVHSDVGKITAIGTMFTVKQDSKSWEVFVTEGRVKIDESATKANLLPEVDRYTVEVDSGQKVIQELSNSEFAPKVESFGEVELTEKLAWRNQIIDMVSAPLEEILREFNRSSSRKAIIVDDELKQRRMTVAIKAGNFEDFIELLKLSQGVSVANSSEGLMELSLSSK